MTTSERQRKMRTECSNKFCKECRLRGCGFECSEILYTEEKEMTATLLAKVDEAYKIMFPRDTEQGDTPIIKSSKNNMTKVEKHARICEILTNLYAEKNHDYGDSFSNSYTEEGMTMVRIRLGDKFNRFKTLSRGEKQRVNDESIRDTLLDLANYAIMTIVEMENDDDRK